MFGAVPPHWSGLDVDSTGVDLADEFFGSMCEGSGGVSGSDEV